MKPIKITDERMAEVLPSEIKNTDVLSNNAKKTLAAIMNYYLLLEEVKKNGYVYLSNELLRLSVGIRKNDVLSAVQELIECDLIERQAGRRRTQCERAMASTYRVKWQNLVKPLKKKTFEELFSEFLKPSETPLGTTDTVTDTASVSVSETVSASVKVLDTGSVKVSDTATEKVKVSEEVEEIVKKPKNLKELNDYFIQRMEKETKGKDLSVDDLNSLETKLEAELEEEFTDIPMYKNIVYLIRGSMEKKREKLIEKGYQVMMY